MKAVVFHEFGGLRRARLEELADPDPGPGEVVVDVTASALNHLDVDVREGVSRFPVELPARRSASSSSGGSRQLGEGVEGWTVGDRVMPYLIDVCGECLYCRTGRESLCTRSVVHQLGSTAAPTPRSSRARRAQLIRVPDGVTDVEAAAIQVAFGTAWHMLFTRARLRPGETVLDQLGRQRHRLGGGAGREARRRVRDRQPSSRDDKLERAARARARRRHQLHDRRTSSRR